MTGRNGSTAGGPQRSGLARGTLRVLLAESLVVPAGLVTAAFLGRAFGPADFGLFMLAASIVLTLQWMVVAMFSRATVKLVTEAADWRPAGAAVLRWNAGAGTAMALGLWLVSGRLAVALGEPLLAPTLTLFALEIPIGSAAAACRSVLSGLEAYRARAMTGALRWILRPLLIIGLVQLGFSVTGAVAGSILAAAATFVVAQSLARVPLTAGAFPAGRLWRLALPVFALAVSLRLLDRVGLFALKAFGGTADEVGWYAAAQGLAVVPGLFAMSFTPLLLAALTAALARGDEATARRVAHIALRLAIGFLPLAAFGAAAAPELIDALFGPGFEPAATLAGPLLLAATALAVISVSTAILIAKDRVTQAGACLWPVLPIAVMAHTVVVPRFGPAGAAMVTCAAACVGAVATVTVVFTVWRLDAPGGTFVRSVLVGCGVAVLAVLWPAPGAWVILKGAVATLAIAAGFAALGEFGPEDRELARRIMRGPASAPAHSPAV